MNSISLAAAKCDQILCPSIFSFQLNHVCVRWGQRMRGKLKEAVRKDCLSGSVSFLKDESAELGLSKITGHTPPHSPGPHSPNNKIPSKAWVEEFRLAWLACES